MRSSSRGLPLVALIALAVGACGGGARGDGAAPARTPAELEALYRARADSARTRFTAADVRFVTDMIGHHAQALEMAAKAESHGASAPVRTLAARVVNAQQDEIERMQAWLADRRQAVPEVHVMDGRVMAHGPGHSMVQGMPGMLTAEQMAELDGARGPDFDRLFLTFMIQHHRGAVTMVERLLAQDGAAQDQAVFKLASDVHVDQKTEIARMESMLAALDGR